MATDSAAPTIYVGNQQPKQDEVVTSNGSTTPLATQREDALAQAADATQAQREAIEADKLSALEDQKKAAVAVDQADANAVQAQADEAKAAEERLAQEHARSEELRSHALGEYDAMAKKVANQRYEDFFAGKDGTSRKIKAGLSILAGGIGAGMQNAGAALLGQVGHFQNQAAEAVNKAIDRDFEKQKAQLAADRDALLQQGAHVNMVNAYTKEHELGIEAERTLAKERTLAEAKAEMVRAGLPAKEIERRVGILQEKLNVNAEKEKYLSDQRHLETPKFAQKTAQRQTMTYAPVPAGSGGALPQGAIPFRNPETGNVEGYSVGPREHKELVDKDVALARAEDQLKALLDDVKKNGTRDMSPERKALFNNALAAVGSVSSLGQNEEALNIEKGTLGESGAGFTLRGANPQNIEKKLKEVQELRERTKRSFLVPLPGSAQSVQAPAAPAARRAAGPPPDVIAQAQAALKPGSGATPQQVAKARRILGQ